MQVKVHFHKTSLKRYFTKFCKCQIWRPPNVTQYHPRDFGEWRQLCACAFGLRSRRRRFTARKFQGKFCSLNLFHGILWMGKYLITNFLIRTEVTKVSSKVELIIYSKGTPSRGPSETEGPRGRYRDVYGTKMRTLRRVLPFRGK